MLENRPDYFWRNLQEDKVVCLSNRQVGEVEIPLYSDDSSTQCAIIRPIREVTRAYALPNMGGVMIDVENVRG